MHIYLWAFAQVGCSSLMIETGRYQCGRYLPPEERKCTMCDFKCIEDEFHVMVQCPMYTDIRETFCEESKNINPAFNHYCLT